MTITQDEVLARCDLAQDFADAGAVVVTHTDAAIPDEFTIQLPVPKGLDRPDRERWLRGVAGSWGVDPVRDEYGVLTAERRFGRIRFAAAVTPPGSAHVVQRADDLAARADLSLVTPFGGAA